MKEDLNNHKCEYVLLPFIDTGQVVGSHETTGKPDGWFLEGTDGFQCFNLFSVMLRKKKQKRGATGNKGVFFPMSKREREISVLSEAAVCVLTA